MVTDKDRYRTIARAMAAALPRSVHHDRPQPLVTSDTISVRFSREEYKALQDAIARFELREHLGGDGG